MSIQKISKTELKQFFSRFYINDIQTIFEYIGQPLLKYDAKKKQWVEKIVGLLHDSEFIDNFINKLHTTSESQKLYSHLIWKKRSIDVEVANKLYGVKLPTVKKRQSYYANVNMLKNEYSFIERVTVDQWRDKRDFLRMNYNIVQILRLFYPKPDDFYLKNVDDLEKTKYYYNNEEGVLQFIHTIQNMLKNGLVEFGKTNEKPLLKTLNILKSSSNINEFFNDKKHSTLATDMLTRSFSFYYWNRNKFDKKEQNSLEDFTAKQLNNQLHYFISRIFASHLKKVRYDPYYSTENELFETLRYILNQILDLSWVSVENIINFCTYRDLYFHLESYNKTDSYYMIDDKNQEITAEDYYDEIFFEPILKASLFYLGALGLFELKYDDPKNNHKIKIKNLEYISVWDSLKYIKVTDLGLFVFGINSTYEAKEIKTAKSTIKFDEYKPIVTIDKSDIITQAKLESYCDIYDTNRYILSYTKLFKDCKSLKALTLKINGFYDIFDTKPPKVFDDFFSEVKQNANALKRDLKLITIELKNNKKLLNLFMTNKKLQELTIKASGYRVLVKKDDISKLTKIVKDNGFFVEF